MTNLFPYVAKARWIHLLPFGNHLHRNNKGRPGIISGMIVIHPGKVLPMHRTIEVNPSEWFEREAEPRSA